MATTANNNASEITSAIGKTNIQCRSRQANPRSLPKPPKTGQGTTKERSTRRSARAGKVSGTDTQKPLKLVSKNFLGEKIQQTPQRLDFEIPDTGVVLVGSDLHAWPAERLSSAFRAFVKFAKVMEPASIILNGDLIDGASIGRWPRIMWQAQPSVKQELEAAQECLHLLTLAAPRHCDLFVTIGNHDARFDAKLAASCPEFENVRGFRLCDHFSDRWQWSWSVWINDSVVVKHRYKGEIHAAHNNVLNSGKTIVTGHLHSLKVTPFSDYSGMRWGIDTGTLSDPKRTRKAIR
jgi:hypothetical protein